MSSQKPSGIEVNTRYRLLEFAYYFSTPSIWIDGVEYQERWGTHLFPVKAGPHFVRISFRYFFARHAGENAIDVNVMPGYVTRLRYTAPWLVYRRRVTYPGMTFTSIAFSPACLAKK